MYRAQCPFPPNAAILASTPSITFFSIIYKEEYIRSRSCAYRSRSLPDLCIRGCTVSRAPWEHVEPRECAHRPYLCMRFPFFCPSRGRKEVLVPLLKTHQRVSQLLGIVLQRSVRFMQPRNHDLPSLCRWGRSTMARRKKKQRLSQRKLHCLHTSFART